MFFHAVDTSHWRRERVSSSIRRRSVERKRVIWDSIFAECYHVGGAVILLLVLPKFDRWQSFHLVTCNVKVECGVGAELF